MSDKTFWAPVAALVAISAAMPAAAPEFEVASIKSASRPTPVTFRSRQFRIGRKIIAGRADFEFVSLSTGNDRLKLVQTRMQIRVSGGKRSPPWVHAW